MFGWYETDLALGRVRDIPPLQGLWFLSGPFSQGVALGYHIVPLWGGRPVPFWGRRPVRRWGVRGTCRPSRAWGFYEAVYPGRCPGLSHCAPLGAEDRCPFWGPKTVAPLGAVDVIGSKNYHPARACGTAHMRLFHCRDSIRCSTFCCISSLS